MLHAITHCAVLPPPCAVRVEWGDGGREMTFTPSCCGTTASAMNATITPWASELSSRRPFR